MAASSSTYCFGSSARTSGAAGSGAPDPKDGRDLLDDRDPSVALCRAGARALDPVSDRVFPDLTFSNSVPVVQGEAAGLPGTTIPPFFTTGKENESN
jgi:hypothetical protein